MFRDLASPAPEWDAVGWFNSGPLTLADLRGRVVVLEAFQMLCPGCVAHGLFARQLPPRSSSGPAMLAARPKVALELPPPPACQASGASSRPARTA